MRLLVQDDPGRQLDRMREVTDAFAVQFSHVIEQLNVGRSAPSQGQVLRLCVEAISLLLDTQSRLADTMSRLHRDGPPLEPRRVA
ncbi:MAG TPA: hypothetical protein PKB10_08525 [Tepidisphaeraceae bacterium]|nr:hypothetical protein [Tepidisphaeraceae bacterium]